MWITIVIAFAISCFISSMSYKKGIEAGQKSVVFPINHYEELIDGLDDFDSDILLSWVRQDGARMELCLRAQDRNIHVLSIPTENRPEYFRVSDGKPMWFEDGSFGLRNGDWLND